MWLKCTKQKQQTVFKANTTNLQTIFIWIFLFGNYCILIQMSLKFVPNAPTANKSVLVLAMAWRLSGNKPLAEPMVTQFIAKYKHNLASMI